MIVAIVCSAGLLAPARAQSCGSEGARPCTIFERIPSCDADLVESGNRCVHPPCGRNGQRACAVFGRNTCDAGLVEFNDTCFARNECGAEGQRPCLLGESRLGCDPDLVASGGVCTHPACGRNGERACSVVGRTTCDTDLVEFNGICRPRGECGGEGARPCLIGEATRPGCAVDLVTVQGVCTHPACGRLDEKACSVLGRTTCDAGLVEFNDMCRQQGDCGREEQRPCLFGEAAPPGCEPDLVMVQGLCIHPACGRVGEKACSISGRNTCDFGLVEFNDTCHQSGVCGGDGERLCLAGERKPACEREDRYNNQGSCCDRATDPIEHPLRGRSNWNVILCQYSDSPAVPVRSAAAVTDMFFGRGVGGLNDFYNDVTRGAVSLGGTVSGYFTVPRTVAEVRAFSHGGEGDQRDLSHQLCVDAARAAGSPPPAGNPVAVLTSPDFDGWGGGGRVFLGADRELAAFGHEVSHGLGLQHSFSDNFTLTRCGPTPKEYGDSFDQMSWICTTMGIPTPLFGNGGPAFNAFHVDRMGWLRRSEVLTFGADGAFSDEVTLTALYHPGFGGVRMVRIPFDADDLRRYFTVELRMPTGWDAGFKVPRFLIHESRRVGCEYQYRSFLQRSSVNGPEVHTLKRDGVTIELVEIDAMKGTARVKISSELSRRCVSGFTPREAAPNDRVCVPGESQVAARVENRLAALRRASSGACLAGNVRREAFPGDNVCVPVSSRDRVRSENALAAERTNPVRFAFGPNACKSGLVWREADERDYVCVPRPTREETRQENMLADARRIGSTENCDKGFVWREAFPEDKVCAPESSRTRAANDNAAANSNRQRF